MKLEVHRPVTAKFRRVPCRIPRRCQQRVRCDLCVGIDLGTTNSAVSVLEEGTPVIVPNDQGQLTTPSVVTFLEEGEIQVGQKARQLTRRYSTSTFSSIKRILGQEYVCLVETCQQ